MSEYGLDRSAGPDGPDAPHAASRGVLETDVREAFARLAAWLDVGDGLWRARETERGSWSAGEIVEHVALCNHYLLLLIEKLARTAADRARTGGTAARESPAAAGRAEARLGRFGRRDYAWPHPVHMTPTGAAPRGVLRERLAEQLAACDRILAELPPAAARLAGARLTLLEGDGAEQRLDVRGWLRFLAVHLERHLAQLERVRAAYGGPR